MEVFVGEHAYLLSRKLVHNNELLELQFAAEKKRHSQNTRTFW